MHLVLKPLFLIGFLILSALTNCWLFFRYRKIRISSSRIQEPAQHISDLEKVEIYEKAIHDFSNELHDNFGQILSLIKINLSILNRDDPERFDYSVSQIRSLVDKVQSGMREMIRSLGAHNLNEYPFTIAIEKEMDRLTKTGLFTTDLKLTGKEINLKPEVELILYRMVQEILNNILKHAAATTILVRLDYSDTSLAVEISDNGKGFSMDPATINRPDYTGMGLKTLRERARIVRAAIHFKSTPGEGTTVNIVVPIVVPADRVLQQ
ncbi:sensor histidine kinase [Flavitalea flava]